MTRTSHQPALFIKLISISVGATFLFTQVLFAHLPQKSVWDERHKAMQNAERSMQNQKSSQFMQLAQLQLPISRPSIFNAVNPTLRTQRAALKSVPAFQSLPLQYVTLRDVHQVTSGKNILIVQDIHLNGEAQANMARMLQQLVQEHRLGMVSVEGAFGPFNFNQFWKAADPQTVRDVADAFFKTNRIGAPAYVGITSMDTDTPYIGVDDLELYQANLDAYKTSQPLQASMREKLATSRRKLELEKQDTFNPELKKFDAAVAAYQSGRISLGDFLKELSVFSSQSSVSHISYNRTENCELRTDNSVAIRQFLQAYRLEQSLDFTQADRERKQILEKLLSKVSKQTVDELVNLSLAYRAGQVRYADYYRYLTSLLQKNSISLTHTPAFESYLRYVSLSDGIDAGQLLRDVRKATDDAFQKLARSDEEKRLIQASRALYLQQRLVEFALTPEEWGEYRNSKIDIRNSNLNSFEAFYEHADARSKKMIENLLSIQGTRNEERGTSVLVVGGFHSPQIARLLREKGFGYVVVSPNVTKIDDKTGSAYLSIFSREKTPLEKLFQGEKLTMYPGQNNIGGPGPFADDPNRDMRVTDRMEAQLRQGKNVASCKDSGRSYQAIDANRPPDTPAGYERIRGAVEPVVGHPIQFLQPSRWMKLKTKVVDWYYRHRTAVEHAILTLCLCADIALAVLLSQCISTVDDGRRAAVGLPVFTTLGKRLWDWLSHAEKDDQVWWRDPKKTFVAVTLPISALRRDPNQDPGIGKFTDLLPYFRDHLHPRGVSVVQLLPHYATLDESPFAPVSTYAMNEMYIDMSVVPEVMSDPELLTQLLAPVEKQDEVDYPSVKAKQLKVTQGAFRKFVADEARQREFKSWIDQLPKHVHTELLKYADFMAIHEILGKSSLDWSQSEMQETRKNERYQELFGARLYAQWVGFPQFLEMIQGVQALGGRVLFDIPMFRGKDSVDVKYRPKYFRDVRKKNPGIRHYERDDQGHIKYDNGKPKIITEENWGDLTLWNWDQLQSKGENFSFIAGPIRYWLQWFDGARNDAMHFAYSIGQFNEFHEPGDAYVKAMMSVFKEGNSFPLAEAFDAKEQVAGLGGVPVDWEWKRLSTHDDHERWYASNAVNFMVGFNDHLRAPVRYSRFISFTLGDLEGGTTATIKRMDNGNSLWKFRVSLKPSKFDLGRFIRFRLETYPELQRSGKSVWDDPSDLRHMFEAAADSFVKKKNGTTEIWAASRDWFHEQWGRDTFIALPGILLTTGRFEEAKQVMRSFAKYERAGLIPNRMPDSDHPEWNQYNTVDGSMWFIQAVKKYVDYTGDWEFAKEMSPTIINILEAYRFGTGYDEHKHVVPVAADPRGPHDPSQTPNIPNRIYMDSNDGFIVSPAQATWMDADPHATGAITPRNGKAVEINALWYANLQFAETLLSRGNVQVEGERREQLLQGFAGITDKVRENFTKKFWNNSENALCDVIDGDLHGGTVRPNQIFAVSHGLDLLSPEQQATVLQSVQKNLLTPVGLRTLDPRDSHYHGHYYTESKPHPGDPNFGAHKDFAYHQGTVWPWLMGAYADALVKVREQQHANPAATQKELRGAFEPLVKDFIEHGSLYEVYDGHPRADGRQHPGGTSSQAWSVAEVFRALSEYGLLEQGETTELSEKLHALALNFDLRFRQRAKDLLGRLSLRTAVSGIASIKEEAERLIAEAEQAFDWRNGWVAKSKQSFKIHLRFMEARMSASRTAQAKDEEEFERKFQLTREQRHDRLTTASGGLGDLGGGWVAEALARMGMVTTLDPNSEAPEVYAFLPNYRYGVRFSQVDEWGWPIPDDKKEAWSAVRPQDYGIDLVRDPENPNQPLTVQVPVTGVGYVNVQFRAVHQSGVRVILMETDANDDPKKQEIFDRLYQGKPSSTERFRQLWVYGLAAEEFNRRFKLPEGPLHLNETATFAAAIARLRTHLEKYLEQGLMLDDAYELALNELGHQLIFFTHTLEEAGLDKFYDNHTRIGDYFREYMEELERKQNGRGQPLLRPGGAGDLASWLIQGKTSSLHHEDLPGFRFRTSQDVYFSPLNFLVKLAYLIKEGNYSKDPVNVVAVSRANAKEAEKFFSSAEVPILERYQVEQKPVQSLTNAVGELYFSDPWLVKLMDLEKENPSDRRTERILNPQDPQAHEIVQLVNGHDLPADYTSPAISNNDLNEILNGDRKTLIWRVRLAVKEQYIRNIRDLTGTLARNDLTADHRHNAEVRLEILKRRWALWTGQAFPDSIDTMKQQKLRELLDPNVFTITWARRVVEYKRMLFALFGKNHDAIEKKIKKRDDEKQPIHIDQILEEVKQERGYSSLEEMCAPFIELIEKENTQLLFAGPTFEDKGRAQVAMLDYVLNELSKTHPNLEKRIIFVEGYNDELSPYLVQGSDVWLNNPKLPREASGTSGMKGSAVNVTTPDGWAADGGFDGLNVLLVRPRSTLNSVPEEMRLPKAHPDFWPEHIKNDVEKRTRYLGEEAESLYGALSKATRMYYDEHNGWLNLRRRSIYYKVNPFSVRSSFIGRYLPSSDTTVAEAGHEMGMFELYDRVSGAMDDNRDRRELLKKAIRMRTEVKFLSNRLHLRQVNGSATFGAKIGVRIPADLFPDVDFFVTWGQKGSTAWNIVPVDPNGVKRNTNPDHYDIEQEIQVDSPGNYAATVFAVVKGLGGKDTPPNLRLYASQHVGDDAEFTRSAPLAPGAAGFWSKSGKSFFAIGVYEGLYALALTLPFIVMPVLFLNQPIGLIQAVVYWLLLTLPALGAGEGFIQWIHRKHGVYILGMEAPVFDRDIVRGAIRTARLSLLGIPLIAAAALWHDWPALILLFAGLLLTFLPHPFKNRSHDRTPDGILFRDEIKLARQIKEVRAMNIPEMEAAFLTELVAMERYDLKSFGQERQNLLEFADARHPSPTQLFMSNAALRGRRNFRVAQLDSLINKHDHVLLYPKANELNDLIQEIDDCLKVIRGKEVSELIVVLKDDQKGFRYSLSDFQSVGVRFVFESELQTSEAVEKQLLGPSLQDGGKLKLLFHADGELPQAMLQLIFELMKKKPELYENLVEFVFVKLIAGAAKAVQAKTKDVESLQLFQEQA